MAVNITSQAIIAGDITELYVSIFGRAPDAEGLDYWVSEIINGKLTIAEVGQSFFDQEEAQETFGNTSDSEFINYVYHNTFNRESDEDGFNYWLNEIESGNISRDRFVEAVLAGAKADTGSVDDQAMLNAKLNVATYYVKNIGTNSKLATTAIELLESPDDLGNVLGTVDYYDGWIKEWSNSFDENAILEDGTIINETLMWENLDNDEFWNSISTDETLITNYNIPKSDSNFWEMDSVIWANISPSEKNQALNFLDEEVNWSPASNGFITYSSQNYGDINYEVFYDNTEFVEGFSPAEGDIELDNGLYLPAGSELLDDGTYQLPDGQVFNYTTGISFNDIDEYNEGVILDNGQIIPAGSTLQDDGSWILPDGQEFTYSDIYGVYGSEPEDGEFIPEGMIVDTDGNVIYDGLQENNDYLIPPDSVPLGDGTYQLPDGQVFEYDSDIGYYMPADGDSQENNSDDGSNITDYNDTSSNDISYVGTDNISPDNPTI